MEINFFVIFSDGSGPNFFGLGQAQQNTSGSGFFGLLNFQIFGLGRVRAFGLTQGSGSGFLCRAFRAFGLRILLNRKPKIATFQRIFRGYSQF